MKGPLIEGEITIRGIELFDLLCNLGVIKKDDLIGGYGISVGKQKVFTKEGKDTGFVCNNHHITFYRTKISIENKKVMKQFLSAMTA